MINGFIKTGAAAPDIHVADCEYNLERIKECVLEAQEQGVKVLAFPELSLTGATCGDLYLQTTLQGEAMKALLDLEAFMFNKDMVITAGLPLRKGSALYDVAAVISGSGILGFVPKEYFPGTDPGARVFSAGEDGIIDINGRSIAMSADLVFSCDTIPELKIGVINGDITRLPYPAANRLASAGASVIIQTAAGGEETGRGRYLRNAVKHLSDSLICGAVYAEAGTGESTTDRVYMGHRVICENGEELNWGSSMDGRLTVSEIDTGLIMTVRMKNGFFSEEEPYLEEMFSLVPEETVLTRTYPRLPFVPEDPEEREEALQEILDIQALGLKKRLEHIRCPKMLLGVSGGLDSTAAILACARAADLMGVPRENVIGVTMPCFGTTDRTYNNAKDLVTALGGTLMEIDIKETVLSHFRDIGHDPENRNTAYENAQARERTQVLMDLANDVNGLVVGTGDLSEHALGWATYNGDHMSMYGVNDTLPKTLMRLVVGRCAKNADDELKKVLEDILDTPVSPELIPAGESGEIVQKTESIIGPYELHDFFVYYMMVYGFGPAKIFRIAKAAFRGAYDSETILKWMKVFYRRFFTQQFKRSCSPDGAAATAVSLSPRGTWNMPSDACADAWLREIDRLMA